MRVGIVKQSNVMTYYFYSVGIWGLLTKSLFFAEFTNYRK